MDPNGDRLKGARPLGVSVVWRPWECYVKPSTN